MSDSVDREEAAVMDVDAGDSQQNDNFSDVQEPGNVSQMSDRTPDVRSLPADGEGDEKILIFEENETPAQVRRDATVIVEDSVSSAADEAIAGQEEMAEAAGPSPPRAESTGFSPAKAEAGETEGGHVEDVEMDVTSAGRSHVDENRPEAEEVTQEQVEDETEAGEEPRSPVDWSCKPRLLALASREYARVKNNYLRGCKWSPDGTCLLVNSRDNLLRLYNLPDPPDDSEAAAQMSPVLRMQEPDLIYDFCWYPLMSSADPVSSCFLSTSRRHAVHLYDAYTGAIRCHYKPMNHLDELEAAMSVAFSYDGFRIYAGFANGVVRVFDLNRPGGVSERRPRLGQRRIQGGIISCIATSPCSHLYAAGSYNRSVALFAEPGSLVAKLRGQGGGVTQLAFSPDARYLISGGRKDPEVLVWDLRRPGTILYTMLRNVGTNQRMYFDLNESGQQIVTGNHSGHVSVFDVSGRQSSSKLAPVVEWLAHADSCNGVSVNEQARLLATTSGQWSLPLPRLLTEAGSSDSSEDDEATRSPRVEENCLKVWHYS